MPRFPQDRHWALGAVLLGVGISFAIEGPVNTYMRAGKLFPGARSHLVPFQSHVPTLVTLNGRTGQSSRPLFVLCAQIVCLSALHEDEHVGAV